MNTTERPGVVALVTDALGRSADLIQTEIRLARVELGEKAEALRTSLVSGIVMMLVGTVFIIGALILVLQALVAALIEGGVTPALAHRHAHPFRRMAVDRCVDRAAGGHHAAADRLVLAVNLAPRACAPAPCAPEVSAPRSAGRWSPCPAGARCRPSAMRPAPDRAPAARSAACDRGCRHRDARPARPAC